MRRAWAGLGKARSLDPPASGEEQAPGGGHTSLEGRGQAQGSAAQTQGPEQGTGTHRACPARGLVLGRKPQLCAGEAWALAPKHRI